MKIRFPFLLDLMLTSFCFEFRWFLSNVLCMESVLPVAVGFVFDTVSLVVSKCPDVEGWSGGRKPSTGLSVPGSSPQRWCNLPVIARALSFSYSRRALAAHAGAFSALSPPSNSRRFLAFTAETQLLISAVGLLRSFEPVWWLHCKVSLNIKKGKKTIKKT